MNLHNPNSSAIIILQYASCLVWDFVGQKAREKGMKHFWFEVFFSIHYSDIITEN